MLPSNHEYKSSKSNVTSNVHVHASPLSPPKLTFIFTVHLRYLQCNLRWFRRKYSCLHVAPFVSNHSGIVISQPAVSLLTFNGVTLHLYNHSFTCCVVDDVLLLLLLLLMLCDYCCCVVVDVVLLMMCYCCC